MSKIALEGNASGTGTFTIASPNSNNNRTLNLPDSSGTLVTTGDTIPVSQGGTGVTSITANNVVLGNGTSAIQTVAPGASGNLLTSNGTTWTSAAPASSYVGGRGQTFTGNGTFTIPTGITAVKVTVVGGGGGSGGGGNSLQASGGGGGGGAAISFLTGLTPGNTLTVTVGSGGTAGNTSGGNGGAGGNSSVASGTQSISTITGNGGSGSNGTATLPFDGGAGGSSSGGTINIVGQGGGAGSGTITCAFGISGTGGSSILGGGGRGRIGSNLTGFAGNLYGGGGGGSCGGGGNAGAAGAAGVVIFEW